VVLRNFGQALLAEPRVPNAPRRVWRDWALVAAFVPTAVLEGALRDDVVWRPLSLVVAVILVFILLWRRTHPLAMVALAFGSFVVLDIVSLIVSAGPVGLYTMAFVLVLAYALARWGAGRELALGLAIMLLAAVLGTVVDFTGVVDAVVGTLFLLFPVSLGISVRYWSSTRLRELDQVKLRERAQLARELHDTVGHHVSAIAIRAQAGQLLASTDPTAAMDALEVIEREASRALAEMRIVVGGLRDGESAPLTPQPGVADLEELGVGEGPRVRIDRSGDLADLAPSVDAAIYRIAQESVTNAVRHAARATRIDVGVAGDADRVRVTVTDDGEASINGRGVNGYGLVGMAERATLLGGTLDAGPDAEGGWRVHAVLPKVGSTR
jgi:signal transduction histidine kinase